LALGICGVDMTCHQMRGKIAAALSLGVFFAGNTLAQAETVLFTQPIINISADSGGRIGDFVSRLHKYKYANAQVAFSGNCDSACTLFLALPHNQTCVNTGAVFRFHAPTAGSAEVGLAAKHFLMANYPGWVRSWINRHNGLTTQLISMDYNYASKFIRSCGTVASR
jgi:hypothetical protein